MLKGKIFATQYPTVDELFNEYIEQHNITSDQIYMLKYVNSNFENDRHIIFLVYDDNPKANFNAQDFEHIWNSQPFQNDLMFLNQSVVQ
jgi:hypothetical protein